MLSRCSPLPHLPSHLIGQCRAPTAQSWRLRTEQTAGGAACRWVPQGDPQYAALFERFFDRNEPDEYRNARWKVIPNVADGSVGCPVGSVPTAHMRPLTPNAGVSTVVVWLTIDLGCIGTGRSEVDGASPTKGGSQQYVGGQDGLGEGVHHRHNSRGAGLGDTDRPAGIGTASYADGGERLAERRRDVCPLFGVQAVGGQARGGCQTSDPQQQNTNWVRTCANVKEKPRGIAFVRVHYWCRVVRACAQVCVGGQLRRV